MKHNINIEQIGCSTIEHHMFKHNLKYLYKYLIAGVLATLLHYIILFSLHNGLNIDILLATTTGALAGAVLNYFINYFYTFDSQRTHIFAGSSFILFTCIGLAINAIVVSLVFYLLALSAITAQVSATLITFAWNYQANRRWTY